MTKKELAALLGISGSMVTRLAKHGMPTDSLERAQRWRKRHLEPSRVKGVRHDSNYRPSPQAQPVRPAPVIDHLTPAAGLLNVAAMALSAGTCIAALVPALRVALAAVPAHERDGLLLPVNVMDILVADVAAVLPPREGEPLNDDGTPVYQDGDTMTDDEAAELGRFWYQVAAGEIRVT